MRPPKKKKRQSAKTVLAELLVGDAEKELERLPDNRFALIVTSPPYNIGKPYEKGRRQTLKAYLEWVDRIVGLLAAKLTKDDSLCWQVGTYVKKGELYPRHRVFAYHEGGSFETEIDKLRKQQNLLATGIIYPPNIKKTDQEKFEARLFLEINSNQRGQSRI